MMATWQSFLIGLVGGLFGSIITVTVQYMRDWLVAPSLRVTANAEVGGCVVETPAYDKNTGKPCGDQRYLRLRIDNRGRTTAKNVCVSIVKITMRATDLGQNCFDEEVMDLTSFDGSTRIDIAPKTHRFINLCHVQKMLDGRNEFSFDVRPVPIRIWKKYNKSAADFDVDLMIAADNAMGGSIDMVSVRYGGTFESFNFV